MLAGDHCKEASDLGVPLVGVGFMYPQGYFHQHVSAEGWQEESYERLNWADAPIEPAIDARRQAVRHRRAARRSHRCSSPSGACASGRVQLYLLDTDLEENAPWDRELSARLYGGDRETRIQQEIILGIGGVRALRALGIEPAVFHLNEGHAGLRRAAADSRADRARARRFDDALEEIRQTTIFTTHTPVPAGHDAFPFHLVEKHLAGCWGTLGPQPRAVPRARIATTTAPAPQFNMTALALRSAGAVNAVSQLHGEVTRAMWRRSGRTAAEQSGRSTSVTNGVHVPTWIAADLADLFAAHLGPDWLERQDDPALWDGVLDDPGRGTLGACAQSLRALPVRVHPRARAAALDDRARRHAAASSPPARCSIPTR